MASDTFAVTVSPMPNVAPEVATPIADVHIAAATGGDTLVDVAANFSDANGDDLTYAVTHGANAADTVTVAISGSELLFTSVLAGTAQFIVTATDPGMLSVADTFVVSAGNRSPMRGRDDRRSAHSQCRRRHHHGCGEQLQRPG